MLSQLKLCGEHGLIETLPVDLAVTVESKPYMLGVRKGKFSRVSDRRRAFLPKRTLKLRFTP